MPIWLIDLFQRVIDLLLLAAIPAAIAYLPLSVIFLLQKKFKHQKIGGFKKWWRILALPLAIGGGAAFFFINPVLAHSRYDDWAKKCGHQPTIGIDNTAIEVYKSVETGDLARMDSQQATKYFCSAGAAKAAGYY